MKVAKRILLSFLIILLILAGIRAAGSPDPAEIPIDKGLHNRNAILLKNAQFDTSIPQPAVASAEILSISQYPGDVEGYYIVQFSGYIREEWKQAVSDTGAVIFDYVPNNAFVVRMDPSEKSLVESLDKVQWIGIYQPSYRISPALSSAISAAGESVMTPEGSGGEEVACEDIIILLFDANDNERVLSGIEDLGGEIVDNAGDIMRVRIDGSKIPDIAIMNGVSWIEKYVQPVILNDVAANITNVYDVRNTHGLTGSGQIVAVADTGLDTGIDDESMHDDIEGRIVALHALWSYYEDTGAEDNSGHGTHVAGSVLGNGLCSNGQYAGMAPEARLVFQAMQYDGEDPKFENGGLYTPINLTSLFQQAYNDSAKIHSNSWGSGGKTEFGNYTSQSQYVDEFMWKNPDMLIIFAAGNGGVTGSIIPPGTAKNALTVGASENDRQSNGSKSDNIDEIADFSSKGPTDDNRIKPDVVAPGTYIISTGSTMPDATYKWGVVNDYYAYASGTSMATPLTAGTAALIRQYYVENESISPSAALLKATLINGAVNMGLSSNEQGWGRVDLEQSLFPASPQIMCYHDDISLDTSESWNVTYCVNDTSESLKITLVWTDAPAAVSAEATLVNNLDLIVTGPDGIYYENGAPDVVNNVEQVELSSPPVGIYTIKVNGTNIPQGAQPFALLISGALVDVTPPIIISATANPATIESNGSEKTTFNVIATGCVGIASVTMNLTSIGGSPTQALDNNSGIWQYTTNTTSLGTFHLPVNVTGNISISNTSVSITLNTTDTTPPTSSTPSDTEFSANTTASFDKWILTDLHPGYYWVLRNGTQIVYPTPWTNNTNITVPIDTNIGLGDFNYTIQYNDTAGNNGTQDSVIITIIDIEPPYASGESPADNSRVCDNTPLISVNIMDNVSGVNPASIVMKVNSSTVTHTITPVTGGYNVSNLTITPFSDTQVVNVTVNATDNNSNILKHNWSFTLDTDTTSPTSNTPSDTEFSANTTASFDKWILTDLHPGYYWVLRNGTEIVSPSPWTNNTNITVPIDTYIGLGDFNYTIQYNDTAGNNGTQDSVIITIIDTTKPILSDNMPQSFTNDTKPTISINATDRGSGINISSAEMKVNGEKVLLSHTSSGFTFKFENTTTAAYNHDDIVNVTFNVLDKEGHTNSTSWMFYINNIAPTTTPTKSRGGGGGGGTSGEDFYNIAGTETQRVSIFKGDNVIYSFENTQNPIKNINFTAKVSTGKIASKVEILQNTSTLVARPAPGKVYKNINIWVGNYGWASEKNIKDMTIRFTVPLDWITSNTIDKDSIALYRYNNDSWERLPTTWTSENENNITFTSSTPSFSPFAISSETVSTSAVVPTAYNTPAALTNYGSDNASDSQTNVCEPGNKEGTIILWVLLIIVIMAVAVIIFLKKDEILQEIKK